MAQPTVSRSAVNVTLARAQLTSYGVVDDPYAVQMLPPKGRRAAAALRLPGLRRLARLSTMPYLAARTLFFDRFVTEALDDGLRQVVVVAAGYDSRAWRLARPGVRFFEVDQPATQADKRARAPAGGPVYVPADVTDPRLAETLVEAGLRPDEPAAFAVEGLTIYLPEEAAARLLTTLADVGAAGSRLGVSFESGFQRQRTTRLLMTRYYRRGGETLQFRLRREDAPSFLAATGWTIEDLLDAPRLESDLLRSTRLAGPVNSTSFIVLATNAP
ncbi:MAG TPA: SAM-dependent methyltransferase [Acidimicrobiales bacterium]